VRGVILIFTLRPIEQFSAAILEERDERLSVAFYGGKPRAASKLESPSKYSLKLRTASWAGATVIECSAGPANHRLGPPARIEDNTDSMKTSSPLALEVDNLSPHIVLLNERNTLHETE
jgi:hypothetical protein